MTDETVTKYRCRCCRRTFEQEYEARMHAENHESMPYQKAGAAKAPSSSKLIRPVEVKPTDAGTEADLSEWSTAGDADADDENENQSGGET